MVNKQHLLFILSSIHLKKVTPSPIRKKEIEFKDTQIKVSLPINYKQWQTEQDTYLLTKSLKQAKYNQRNAAKLLGLSYHQFRGMLRKYNMIGNESQS